MEYNKLASVTGLGGLFELLSSKSDGAVVRSLEDNSTKFVSSRIHNFSHLESIEVYTVKDNVNLVDVFLAMKASSEKLPDAGNPKAVKAYFEKVYPDMDFSRVYASDMKKMIKWYEILVKNEVEIKLSEIPASADDAEVAAPAVTKAKPAEQKAAPAKSNAPAKKINTPRKMA
ncbi:MAG: DUF5606 domain-containing protein [Bacteroidetes bacterium]|nr:DUF5606 domain-containing protein [Bacteroidota bacterium]